MVTEHKASCFLMEGRCRVSSSYLHVNHKDHLCDLQREQEYFKLQGIHLVVRSSEEAGRDVTAQCQDDEILVMDHKENLSPLESRATSERE